MIYTTALGFPTSYPTLSQTVAFRLPNANIKSFSQGNDAVKDGKEVRYGPFEGDGGSISLHYQTSDAVINVEYERKVQVSQWAGILSFEDRYVIHHDGAGFDLNALMVIGSRDITRI